MSHYIYIKQPQSSKPLHIYHYITCQAKSKVTTRLLRPINTHACTDLGLDRLQRHFLRQDTVKLTAVLQVRAPDVGAVANSTQRHRITHLPGDSDNLLTNVQISRAQQNPQ